MAVTAPYWAGIPTVRTDPEIVSNLSRKLCEGTTMTRSEAEPGDSSMSTKLVAPRPGDFSVTTVEKLRFADTDRNGHITNTVFAVCCQSARMELLCDPKRVPLPRNTQFVIAKLVLEFRAEMHWPGTVEIGTRVERVGRSSVSLAQALFMNERCSAIAHSVVALMDIATRRSVPLPEETADALRAIARWNCGQVHTPPITVAALQP